jgi:hypothetical protein
MYRLTSQVVFSVVMNRNRASNKTGRAEPPMRAESRGVASTTSVRGMTEPIEFFQEPLFGHTSAGKIVSERPRLTLNQALAGASKLLTDSFLSEIFRHDGKPRLPQILDFSHQCVRYLDRRHA